MADKQRTTIESGRTPEGEAIIVRLNKVSYSEHLLDTNPAIARLLAQPEAAAPVANYSEEVRGAVEALAADRDKERLEALRQDIAVIQNTDNGLAEQFQVWQKPNEELDRAA